MSGQKKLIQCLATFAGFESRGPGKFPPLYRITPHTKAVNPPVVKYFSPGPSIRVQAISREPIADANFKIPDGYRKMEIPQIPGMPAGR